MLLLGTNLILLYQHRHMPYPNALHHLELSHLIEM